MGHPPTPPPNHFDVRGPDSGTSEVCPQETLSEPYSTRRGSRRTVRHWRVDVRVPEGSSRSGPCPEEKGGRHRPGTERVEGPSGRNTYDVKGTVSRQGGVEGRKHVRQGRREGGEK